MPRPNTNFEPKKEALARLAFDLFMQQGYEGTTITQIMKAAGITKAGMYHYFASKEDILDAAIEYGVTQDIKITRESMSGLCVEEKMLFFIRGATVPNEFMQKLFRLKQLNPNSYAAYRIRERLVHAYIPLLEDILVEGSAGNVYKVAHPHQTAEFMVLCSKALVEQNVLPAASASEATQRAQVFLQLMQQWLCPAPAHAKEITDLFENMLTEMHAQGSSPHVAKEALNGCQ